VTSNVPIHCRKDFRSNLPLGSVGISSLDTITHLVGTVTEVTRTSSPIAVAGHGDRRDRDHRTTATGGVRGCELFGDW
jgi:hypothetical protein